MSPDRPRRAPGDAPWVELGSSLVRSPAVADDPENSRESGQFAAALADDGNVSDNDACLQSCAIASCGDGVVQFNVEECDDGNADNTDACVQGCKFATCGDGYVEVGEEQCEDGNDVGGDGCLDCMAIACGNGVADPGEQCDPKASPFADVKVAVCQEDCKIEACFVVTNGPDKDITGNTWFDGCAGLEATTVALTLLDAEGKLVYFAHGAKKTEWKPSVLTAAGAAPELEYDYFSHKAPVTLNRLVPQVGTDMLMVPSKLAAQKVNVAYDCWTDLGDGYAVAVFDAVPQKKAPKLLVAGYAGGVSMALRKFKQWSALTEISYFNGAPQNLCLDGMPGPTGFIGTFFFSVL